jgi:hypothetical protein
MLTQGMNALTREIVTAYDARVAALSRLRKTTRTRIARFTEERKRLATRQRASLAQARTDLTKSVSAFMQPITADRVAAHEKWRSLAAAMHGRRTSATTPSATKPAAGQAAPLEPAAVAPVAPTPVATVARVAPGEQSRPR